MSEEKIKNKTATAEGLIRTRAVVPFLIVTVLFLVYFKFFFDSNLRSTFEWIGYRVIGSEVDIKKVETSFIHGTFRVQGIEVTNPDLPTHNMVEIGDIHFAVLWDGLLRAKVVVDEMAVEQIAISTERKFPGKVKHEEPSSTSEAKKLGESAAKATKEKYKDNVLGDVSAILSGSSSEEQFKNIEENLPSKKKLKEFEKELQEKSNSWNERLKTLPQSKEIEALGQELSKVKTSNFKNPQELVDSLQKIDAILKDADGKYKTISSVANDLNADISNTNKQFNEIDALVKKDIADLQARFRIPKIDAKSLTTAILQQYLAPYMSKFNHYKAMVDKYIPPNLMKKGDKNSKESEVPDLGLQAHPQRKGVTYEFGRQNSYPMFWIKRIIVSSAAGASKNAGNIKGLVTDVTSNQVLIGKPTVAHLEGSFPNLEISDIVGNLNIDNRKALSDLNFDFKVGSYAIAGRDVISSPEAKIAFKNATGSINTHGELVGLKDFSLNLENKISKINYDISAQNPVMDDLLKNIFKGIPVVSIDAKGKGELPDLNLDINSNIGAELQKGFEKQISRKVNEAKQKFDAAINEAIGNERARVATELNQMKSQAEGAIKKIQDQINKEKAKAEKKADQSKNESEHQAQKQLEQQGQKQLDDLKKKFGL